jgi:hypothetical protein
MRSFDTIAARAVASVMTMAAAALIPPIRAAAAIWPWPDASGREHIEIRRDAPAQRDDPGPCNRHDQHHHRQT